MAANLRLRQCLLYRDNYRCGSVSSFLKDALTDKADVAIVSAYFTIHAYSQLKEKLDSIAHLQFLFGEPTFIKSVSDENHTPRAYQLEDDTLQISPESQLPQGAIARSCAAWLRAKAEIRSVVKPNFAWKNVSHYRNRRQTDSDSGQFQFYRAWTGYGKRRG
ncbi:MAG: hypothetical protein Ta2A_00620 [Treponemataceae bacterium]|nr:MAG: hypothetical protein Ta2A_00620 [Treponemataceae bacterium]